MRIYDLRFTIYDLHALFAHASRITHHDALKRQLTITHEPIDEAALLAGRKISSGMGAAIYFVGVVRESEDGANISAIDYEAFPKMVEHQFELIFQHIEKRWPIESVRVVHRIGVVNVNDPSL